MEGWRRMEWNGNEVANKMRLRESIVICFGIVIFFLGFSALSRTTTVCVLYLFHSFMHVLHCAVVVVVAFFVVLLLIRGVQFVDDVRTETCLRR